jgi:hypothetical protein
MNALSEPLLNEKMRLLRSIRRPLKNHPTADDACWHDSSLLRVTAIIVASKAPVCGKALPHSDRAELPRPVLKRRSDRVVPLAPGAGARKHDVRRGRRRTDVQGHLNNEWLIARKRAELRAFVVVDADLVVLHEI